MSRIGAFFRYVVLYDLKAFAYIPVTYLRRVLFGRSPYWRQYFFSRWGVLPGEILSKLKGRQVVFIDALGLGEVQQISAFCGLLKQKLTGYAILIFTNNKDSFDVAGKIAAVDCVIDSCWDIPFVCRRVLRLIKPEVILVVENAHFPNLLNEAKKMKIKTALLSGFFVDGWRQNAFMKRSFFLKSYNSLGYIFVKEEADEFNFKKIISDAQVLENIGDLKFDLIARILNSEQIGQLRRSIGIGEAYPLIIAGCIHRYEVDFLLDALKILRTNYPQPKLILAPRWLSDVDFISQRCKEKGLSSRLRTDQAEEDGHPVFILNTYGELKNIYSLADIVYIGGSLNKHAKVNEGKGWEGLCHNPVEPVLYLKPFFFGSNIGLRRGIFERFLKVFPPLMADTPEKLAYGVRELLSNREIHNEIVNLSRQLLSSHKDIASKYAERVSRILIAPQATMRG
jgi:3-deoxy-D-manno-octulosonic-acid transferase